MNPVFSRKSSRTTCVYVRTEQEWCFKQENHEGKHCFPKKILCCIPQVCKKESLHPSGCLMLTYNTNMQGLCRLSKPWWRVYHGFWLLTCLWPHQLEIILGSINLKLHQDSLQENIKVAIHHLNLNISWMKQKDSGPKPTKLWFVKKKMRVLNWPIQLPDLSPIRMLRHDLKRTAYAWNPRNINELFCEMNISVKGI